MRIETGSQNISRIKGEYLYANAKYNNSPIKGVQKIKMHSNNKTELPDFQNNPNFKKVPVGHYLDIFA